MDLNLPYLGNEGDLETSINPGKGDPWATIRLSKDSGISLQWLTVSDCDRLIKAAAAAKQQILDARAKAAAPHKAWMATDGDSCLHCGKPEADELHADPDPPGCICDIASADQCPVHRSEAAVAPELTVRERAQRGARKAAEREAAGEGGVLFPAGDEDEFEVPKVYVRPCTDQPDHEPCSGLSGLCDCDCHSFAASVMAS